MPGPDRAGRGSLHSAHPTKPAVDGPFERGRPMIDDYLLPVEGVDTERLLADWRWLIGAESYSIRAIAAVGNVFLDDQTGRVFLLSIEDGSFDRIAQSAVEFETKLGERNNRKAWLQSFLVREMRRL